jgi:hypothetical protein
MADGEEIGRVSGMRKMKNGRHGILLDGIQGGGKPEG